MTFLVLPPHSFDYCGFVVSYKIEKYESFNFLLFFLTFFFFKIIFAVPDPLHFYMYFRNRFPGSLLHVECTMILHPQKKVSQKIPWSLTSQIGSSSLQDARKGDKADKIEGSFALTRSQTVDYV